jgi:hypothetical protein
MRPYERTRLIRNPVIRTYGIRHRPTPILGPIMGAFWILESGVLTRAGRVNERRWIFLPLVLRSRD